MFATPAEGTLKDFMEFAEIGFADHEQSPPNQRTHATEHYAELINRNRRYGRFRHASSLPKPTRTPSNLTPRNLPLSSLHPAASNRPLYEPTLPCRLCNSKLTCFQDAFRGSLQFRGGTPFSHIVFLKSPCYDPILTRFARLRPAVLF
jgi:hypothetical protein